MSNFKKKKKTSNDSKVTFLLFLHQSKNSDKSWDNYIHKNLDFGNIKLYVYMFNFSSKQNLSESTQDRYHLLRRYDWIKQILFNNLNSNIDWTCAFTFTLHLVVLVFFLIHLWSTWAIKRYPVLVIMIT